ncbi:MAG: DUF1624 domain-containing protein [Acidobacteriota bacterium]|nr:DUF1624 domain-containing protein [Acidobacteriota bacterium]
MDWPSCFSEPRSTSTSSSASRPPTEAAPEAKAPAARVPSVDALRGFVMIVMALDHVRDFTSNATILFQPEDLTRTTAALFFTRWITHICAPVFMFTAGLGAFFLSQRGRAKSAVSRFLLTRGLWLLLLELTVMRTALTFQQGPMILEVLWALGWSMIVLAALIHIPVRPLAILSIGIICLHNLTDPVAGGWLWKLLHQRGLIVAGGIVLIPAYPIAPWFAVMSAGFCFGRIMTLDPEARQKWLLRIGLGLTLAFLAVRGLNLYGDPQPWSAAVPGRTALSFLNTTKYPPSLAFLLMTLGPAILLLRRFGRMTFSDANPLIVFGRVPLFYFVVHFCLARAISIAIAAFRYGHVWFMMTSLPSPGAAYPAGYGVSLPAVYAIWAAVVLALYPACRWFMRVKQRRHVWWLSYL